jgi:hypothetical protein
MADNTKTAEKVKHEVVELKKQIEMLKNAIRSSN